MRTLKFRAWDKTKKLMIYPDSDLIKTHHEGSFPPDGMEVEITLEGDAYINYQYAYESPSYLDNELTLLQFTGLYDKNGVEIYEGDIVHCKHGIKGEVYWAENWAMWAVCGEALMRNIEGEVIGNIYEEASE